MSAIKIVAIVLLISGTLALIYGGFTYNKDHHTARIGSIELTANQRETINIPVWAGVAVLVAGAAMLVASKGGRGA